MGVVISRKPCSVMACRRAATTWQRRMMLFFTAGVPQVQIAVLQAGGLVGLPAAVDGEGQLVVAAAAQHLDFAGHHLDLAGGQLGVLAVPLPDGALHGDGGLLVDGLERASPCRRSPPPPGWCRRSPGPRRRPARRPPPGRFPASRRSSRPCRRRRAAALRRYGCDSVS